MVKEGNGVRVTRELLEQGVQVVRAAGAEVGWGYQLQSPAVVGALALLIFAAALNMAGVFDLVPVGGGLSAAAQRAPITSRSSKAHTQGTPMSPKIRESRVLSSLTDRRASVRWQRPNMLKPFPRV